MKIEDLEFHNATQKPMRAMYDEPAMAYQPTIHLDSGQLPEIKDWTFGEDYILVLKVKQVSVNINKSNEPGGENYSAGFDIEEVAGYYEEKKSTDETQRNL